MEHTFQRGDCIVGPHGKGVFVKYGYDPDNVHVQYRMVNECVRFLHTVEAVSHDTELRNGDWVRYVAVDALALREDGIKGKITYICEVDSITVDWGDNDIGNHNRKYLVKIQPPQEEPMQERQEDAIELGIQEKIRLLERQVEKAKCCLETYRDLKVFINQGELHGTR